MSDADLDAETAQLDREIGERLRLARKARGLSQTELGAAVGITFQQMQKYERGTNRVSSSAMILFSRRLDVPVTELLGVNDNAVSPVDWTLFDTPGARDVLENLRQIKPRLRRVVLDLAAELAADPATSVS
jgi:transcriptional regulator with XRE-family HTH domain